MPANAISPDTRDFIFRRLRELEMDQRELAAKIGVDESSISHLVNRRRGVSLGTLQKVADALQVPVAALVSPPAKPPTAIATSGPDERRLTPEDLEALRLIMREEVERVFRERGLPPPTEDELP